MKKLKKPNTIKQAFSISVDAYNGLRKFKELTGVPYSTQMSRALKLYWEKNLYGKIK